MIYKVCDILEDTDYGCEERSEDAPLLSEAVLEDTGGGKRYFKMPEVLFQERGILAGDYVYIDENETLQKAIVSRTGRRSLEAVMSMQKNIFKT